MDICNIRTTHRPSLRRRFPKHMEAQGFCRKKPSVRKAVRQTDQPAS
jgi:hypothetical protein